MPHLRFRSIDKSVVQKMSVELPVVLANAMQTSVDNFTFEFVETIFFENSKEIASYPFVEVLWFARSQEIQDLSAKMITDAVKQESSAADVVVVFVELSKNCYYENGEHF